MIFFHKKTKKLIEKKRQPNEASFFCLACLECGVFLPSGTTVAFWGRTQPRHHVACQGGPVLPRDPGQVALMDGWDPEQRSGVQVLLLRPRSRQPPYPGALQGRCVGMERPSGAGGAGPGGLSLPLAASCTCHLQPLGFTSLGGGTHCLLAQPHPKKRQPLVVAPSPDGFYSSQPIRSLSPLLPTKVLHSRSSLQTGRGLR